MVNGLLLGLVWYLTLTCFGMIVLPLSAIVFRRMPDGGILLSRPLGWLLLAFGSWWAAYLHILPFSRLGIGIIAFALLGLSSYLFYKRRDWTVKRLRQCWRTARNGEIFTMAVFVLFLLARMNDPGIDTTEKPMDIMMLDALTVTSKIPPPDPWLAGFTINYHYGGYLLHSIPAKLTGIRGEIAYNLAIPSVAALGAAIAFVLGRALFGRCRYAVIAPISIFFISNPASFSDMIYHYGLPQSLYNWRWEFLWKTSRVIYDANGETINEYPLFALLWGDLHPHFSDIPFLMLFLALCYAVFRGIMAVHPMRLFRYEWPLLVVTAVSCGYILPTNVFDFPIGALFFVGIVLFTAAARFRNFSFSKKDIFYLLCLGIPVLGYLLALPFWMHFNPPQQDHLVRISPDHSTLIEFLLVFGLHAAATIAYFLLRFEPTLRSGKKEEVGFVLGLLGILFFGLWAWYGYIVCALVPVLALGFWLVALQTALSRDRSDTTARNELFASIACGLAWSMIAGCEFIYLKDNYAVARMNTLFKMHFPAWFLLGIGLPYLFYCSFLKNENTWFKGFIVIPVVPLCLMSIIPSMYAFAALTYIPSDDRPVTLDGLAFMQRGSPHHYAIIEWIRNNSEPDDLILEVPGCGYRATESAISAFTGRPTMVGWVNHEGLWRAHESSIGQRKDEALRFYTTQHWEEAKTYLKVNGIKFVILVTPECEDKNQQRPLIPQAAFRQHLKPIVQETGHVGFHAANFELYPVPDDL